MSEHYKYLEARDPIESVEFSRREIKTINDLGLTREDLKRLLEGPPFAEGSYALIFELVDSQQKVVAKVWKNPKQDTERAERENVALRLLRRQKSGKAPRLKGFLKSAAILFEEKIEGKSIENFDKIFIGQLAEALVKIHSIELNAYGKPLARRKRGTKMDFFNDEIDRLRADLSSSPGQLKITSLIGPAIEKMKNEAEQKSKKFRDKNFTLIHFDLNQNNILRSVDGKIVIVDWEQASAGDSVMDIAKLFLKLDFNEDQKEDFLVEYEKRLLKKDDSFRERLEIFEPLVLINSILWRLRVLKDGHQEAASVNEKEFYARVKNNLDKELGLLKKYLS